MKYYGLFNGNPNEANFMPNCKKTLNKALSNLLYYDIDLFDASLVGLRYSSSPM